PQIDHRRKHSVEGIVDRNVVRPNTRTRIAEAVEQALALGKGVMHVAHVEPDLDESKWKVERFSQHLACESCGRRYEALNPHHFPFNSPLGWCPSCEGLGVQHGANAALLIRGPRLSVRSGAVAAWPTLDGSNRFLAFAEAIARHAGFSLDVPYQELSPQHQRAILHGTGDEWIPLPKGGGTKFQYKGLYPAIDEASRVSFAYRQRLEHLVDEVPCSTCHGSRLRADAAAVRFADQTLGQLAERPIGDTVRFFKELNLSKQQRQVAGELLREITSRPPVLAQC